MSTTLTKLLVGAVAVVALFAGTMAAFAGGDDDDGRDNVAALELRKAEDEAPAELVDDDEGDGDKTRGDDGTGGGNNTGDGDNTRGNDGTRGGDNTGDRDNTRGNDGTGGGDNTGDRDATAGNDGTDG